MKSAIVPASPYPPVSGYMFFVDPILPEYQESRFNRLYGLIHHLRQTLSDMQIDVAPVIFKLRLYFAVLDINSECAVVRSRPRFFD